MILLEDTRQQAGKHKAKHKWFQEHGIHVNRTMLVCGDYQLPGRGDVAVDTKFSISELIGDVQIKAMTKKDIEKAVNELYAKNHISGDANRIYRIITDDDSDRFAEKEISDFCFENRISEEVMKEFQKLYVKRHGFFHRGLVRAKNYGVKLYVLVENEDGVDGIDSLFRWVNPRSKYTVSTGRVIGRLPNGRLKYQRVPKYPNCMKGEQLAKACLTMQLKYGCTFVFCKPSEAAEKIVELLEGKHENV